MLEHRRQLVQLYQTLKYHNLLLEIGQEPPINLMVLQLLM